MARDFAVDQLFRLLSLHYAFVDTIYLWTYNVNCKHLRHSVSNIIKKYL